MLKHFEFGLFGILLGTVVGLGETTGLSNFQSFKFAGIGSTEIEYFLVIAIGPSAQIGISETQM